MKRRSFISAALCALPVTAALGDGFHVDYTPDAYRAALASGEPLLLDFYAPW